MAERIQLSRTRGWRLPPRARSVARPTKYGNPFRVEQLGDLWTVTCSWPGRASFDDEVTAKQFAVGRHRSHLLTPYSAVVPFTVDDVIAELGEYDYLGCWCALNDPWCHADNYVAVLAQR